MLVTKQVYLVRQQKTYPRKNISVYQNFTLEISLKHPLYPPFPSLLSVNFILRQRLGKMARLALNFQPSLSPIVWGTAVLSKPGLHAETLKELTGGTEAG